MARLGWTRDITEIPDAGGAYALLVRLDRPLELPRRFGGRRLCKGCYWYVGSARAAGGIRGRCARHLRGAATRRWHVDWLIAGALDRWVAAFPKQSACEVLNRLLGLEGLRSRSPASAIPTAGVVRAICLPSSLPAWPHFPIASPWARQGLPLGWRRSKWRC